MKFVVQTSLVVAVKNCHFGRTLVSQASGQWCRSGAEVTAGFKLHFRWKCSTRLAPHILQYTKNIVIQTDYALPFTVEKIPQYSPAEEA
jgi:hypothetical protein